MNNSFELFILLHTAFYLPLAQTIVIFFNIMKNTFRRAAFLLLYCVQSLPAQLTSTLTIDDGLSQNYIYDILQDRKGFLWFGTKEGLNRYDGYSFVTYRNDPLDPHSLSNNTVTSLYEDNTGTLWVGTVAGGLNKFDRLTETFVRISFGSSVDDFGQLDHINAISAGSNGVLWIGTLGGGLVRFDPHTQEVKRFLPDSSKRPGTLHSAAVFDVVEDDSIVWIANQSALSSFNLRTQKFKNFIRPDAHKSDPIITLFKTSGGDLLVAHRYGVDKFDGSGFLPFITADDSNQLYRVGRIKEDHDGNLWLVAEQRVAKYDQKKNLLLPVIIIKAERLTRGLYIDISNVVWCGTTGWGVYISNQKVAKFGKSEGSYLYKIFQREFSVVDEYVKKGKINFEMTFSYRGGFFPSCLRDRSGNTWLLTAQRLCLYEKNTGRLRTVPTNPLPYKSMPIWEISRVYEDRTGNIWLGTVGGISRFNRENFTFDYYRLYPDSAISSSDLNQSSYKDISAIYQDRGGVLWIGTPTLGLIRFDPSQGQIKYFVNRKGDSLSLSNNHILSICEDPGTPDSVLWIGTDGGGLNRFHMQTETFSSFTQRNNFPNNVVYGILTDKNNFLWMSTNNGLIKMNPRTYELKQYDVRDGLQSNEFNRNEYYKAHDGMMYFGGIYGYNAFMPEEIDDNPVVPNVVLTGFSIFNKAVTHRSDNSPLPAPLSETRAITLDYSQNMFTFEFSALEFSAPSKNQYAYKLEGFDDNWNYTGTRRRATYTNLDPGEYLFRVKASNCDGVWNNEGTSLAVTVLPPFYMTWWFRGFILLLIVAAGSSAFYLRVTQLTRERKRQEEISKLLIQNQERERKRIAQEMHDVLGQELLVIKNRAIMGLKTSSEESKEKKQLEQISLSSSSLLKTVREISHNLRPPELDRLGLSETLRAIVTNVKDASPFTLTGIIDSVDGLIDKEDEINIVRIVQEALSNAVKYADAKEVLIEILQEYPFVVIRVKDDGRGFDREKITPGMGLAGISERVRILHGTVSVQSEPGKGTTIAVHIPVNGPTQRT